MSINLCPTPPCKHVSEARYSAISDYLSKAGPLNRGEEFLLAEWLLCSVSTIDLKYTAFMKSLYQLWFDEINTGFPIHGINWKPRPACDRCGEVWVELFGWKFYHPCDYQYDNVRWARGNWRAGIGYYFVSKELSDALDEKILNVMCIKPSAHWGRLGNGIYATKEDLIRAAVRCTDNAIDGCRLSFYEDTEGNIYAYETSSTAMKDGLFVDEETRKKYDISNEWRQITRKILIDKLNEKKLFISHRKYWMVGD